MQSKNFTTRDGLASNVVNCGLQDRQGYLWLGTNLGLTRFDGHRFENFYVEEEGMRLIGGITDIVEDTTRNILLMSSQDYRLLCFDLGRMCFVKRSDVEFPTAHDRYAREREYVSRAQSLGIERGNKTNRRHDLHYLKLDDGRELFATIDNGLFLYDPATNHLSHHCSTDENPVIESDYLNGFLQDRSGGIWLFTTFAGIYQLVLDNKVLMSHPLTGNIRSFSQLSDHEIAVADMDGNLFCYDLNTLSSRLIFNEGHRVYTTNTDSKGRLWIGTRGGGVWTLHHKTVKRLDEVPARQIYDIVIAPDETLWIGSLDGGLIEGRQTDDGEYTFKASLANVKVHELCFDTKGRLWLATEMGIFVKDGESTYASTAW